MRRGLLAWSEQEVPKAVLEARVQRCRRAMAIAGLDCLVVYTNFPRPAAVSYLTHFVPYWSHGVLVVFADRAPALALAMSKRVSGWIASTAHAGDIVCTPDPGATAAKLIDDAVPGISRLGVVELDALPVGVAGPLAAGLPGAAMEDASALFAAVRAPLDEAEIALTKHAAAIAGAAMQAGFEAADDDCAPVTEAVERTARLHKAEEVTIRLAPDLERDGRLRRIEGEEQLGAGFALQVSVAYKGHWVRLGRSAARSGDLPGWRRAEDAFDGAIEALRGGGGVVAALADFTAWTIEGCVGTRPLSILAGSGLASPGLAGANGPDAGAVALAGGVRVLNARMDTDDGPWLASETVVVGGS